MLQYNFEVLVLTILCSIIIVLYYISERNITLLTTFYYTICQSANLLLLRCRFYIWISYRLNYPPESKSVKMTSISTSYNITILITHVCIENNKTNNIIHFTISLARAIFQHHESFSLWYLQIIFYVLLLEWHFYFLLCILYQFQVLYYHILNNHSEAVIGNEILKSQALSNSALQMYKKYV